MRVLKKLLTTCSIAMFLLLLTSLPAEAQLRQDQVSPECQGVTEGGCNSQGYVCRLVSHPSGGVNTLQQSTARCGAGSVGTSVLGGVPRPSSINLFNARVDGTGEGIGIIFFVSNLITLFTIIAGIWVLFNILSAGYLFITSAGDAGTFEKVREQLTMSVIGVAIIAGAYMIAGLIGLVLFDDASYILNPQLSGWNN